MFCPRRPCTVRGGDLARANPGRWVRVGEPRLLAKPPTSWVSEVNLGKKTCLAGPGETWEATYERTGQRDGGREEFAKLVRVTVATTANRL